jgi:hypothetical protein
MKRMKFVRSCHYSAPRSFYPQLVFPPRTINNFQRHPCHEVVVITVYFGPEKAGVGGSTPSLATTFQSTYSESLDLS